jgi:hypothetical protein
MACRAAPDNMMRGIPDRRRSTTVVLITALLAMGRQMFCSCLGRCGVGVRVPRASNIEGTLWRAAGWLTGRWREFLPLGLGQMGQRSEPPAVALGDNTPNQTEGQTAPRPCRKRLAHSTRDVAGKPPELSPGRMGGPIPRKGRPNRTNHYENQAGVLLLAANLKQFNKDCHHADGGTVPSIQTPVENRYKGRHMGARGPQRGRAATKSACRPSGRTRNPRTDCAALVDCCRRWGVC